MLTPRRAPVRPRVLSPVTGDCLPLEDEVRELIPQALADRALLDKSAGWTLVAAVLTWLWCCLRNQMNFL